MTDRSGMFQDFNFKLVVIDALLDKQPGFEAELQRLKKQHTDHFEWYADAGPIQEMLDFFAGLSLEPSDLDSVTELCFDGGNQIYHLIQPDWDGEDDQFDVISVEGFQKLRNLESVTYISMCEPEVLEPMKASGIRIE